MSHMSYNSCTNDEKWGSLKFDHLWFTFAHGIRRINHKVSNSNSMNLFKSTQSINQYIRFLWTFNQSSNQSINQSNFNQSINQSINSLILMIIFFLYLFGCLSMWQVAGGAILEQFVTGFLGDFMWADYPQCLHLHVVIKCLSLNLSLADYVWCEVKCCLLFWCIAVIAMHRAHVIHCRCWCALWFWYLTMVVVHCCNCNALFVAGKQCGWCDELIVLFPCSVGVVVHWNAVLLFFHLPRSFIPTNPIIHLSMQLFIYPPSIHLSIFHSWCERSTMFIHS